MSKRIRWWYSGDVNMLDYGGSYYRNVGGRKFQRIGFDNLEDTDIEGDKYYVTLDYINLDEVSEKELNSAIDSYGCDGEIVNDSYLAMCMFGWSGGCNLNSWRGSNGLKIIAEAKRCANIYLDNNDKLESSLNRVVNAIGSTSREMGRGDIRSALNRCKIHEELASGKIITMKQSDILKCKFAILDLSHYRDDGSCKCNDPEHRKFMIENWEYSESDFKTEELPC
jgi:hypothetical protein